MGFLYKHRYKITFILYIVLFSFINTGCHSDSKIKSSLDIAESIMENRPDSALTILDSINRDDLNSNKNRARYALLRSMALDKNDIQLTTFNILQPAIDYYPHHGTPNQKLRTYYYQGCIYFNKNMLAESIHSYNLALEQVAAASDSLGIALVYMAKAAICMVRYDINGQLSFILKASSIYSNIKKPEKELECLQRALESTTIISDRHLGDSIYRKCGKIITGNPDLKRKMLPFDLSYTETFFPEDSVRILIDKYENSADLNTEEIYALANACSSINLTDKANRIIERVKPLVDKDDSIHYLACKYKIYENSSQSDSAFHYYKEVSAKIYEEMITDSKKDIDFVNKTNEEERIKQEKLHKKQQALGYSIFSIIILVFLTAASIYGIKYYREKSKINAKNAALERLQKEIAEQKELLAVKEKEEALQAIETEKMISEQLKVQVSQLETEKLYLHRIISERRISKDAAKVLNERISMLNKLITNRINLNPQNIKEYNKWIESLIEDRHAFKKSTTLFYEATYPYFMMYLKNHGLTQTEIEYVCLYALGLTGKEVANYLDLKSHYNHTRIIREKLGLGSNETNMRRYISKMIDNFSIK